MKMRAFALALTCALVVSACAHDPAPSGPPPVEKDCRYDDGKPC